MTQVSAGVGLMVGLGDLEGLFQLKWFNDSMPALPKLQELAVPAAVSTSAPIGWCEWGGPAVGGDSHPAEGPRLHSAGRSPL